MLVIVSPSGLRVYLRDGGRDGGSSGAGLSAKVRRDVGAADGGATVDVERACIVVKSASRQSDEVASASRAR
jgi:hypothetical protein